VQTHALLGCLESQQSYLGSQTWFLYLDKFEKQSINQYKLEERSIVAKRLLSFKNRVDQLGIFEEEKNWLYKH
jgi:hypothetical protein